MCFALLIVSVRPCGFMGAPWAGDPFVEFQLPVSCALPRGSVSLSWSHVVLCLSVHMRFMVGCATLLFGLEFSLCCNNCLILIPMSGVLCIHGGGWSLLGPGRVAFCYFLELVSYASFVGVAVQTQRLRQSSDYRFNTFA